MNKKHILPYTGEALQTGKGPLVRMDYHFKFTGTKFEGIELGHPIQELMLDPYFPSSGLTEAIELMQISERPLLLRGEPGSGKTRIAQAVAYEFYQDEADFNRYYFEWHIKSTSKARDGLYTFDHIARLRDANRDNAGREEESLVEYRSLGPLGRAFLASTPEKPAILLIDEIDKADLDFPNDLLLELDQMRFTIPETGEEIIPKRKPLIFITSNQEKELPQAFLRRCLFLYIQFPDEHFLEQIVKANFPYWDHGKDKEQKSDYLFKALARFKEIHDKLSKEPLSSKELSISELKDWIGLLEHYHKKGEMGKISLDEGSKTPFLSSLIKTEKDQKIWGEF